MNKKLKTTLIICLIIIGVAAIGVGMFFLFKPSDKKILTNHIETSFKNLKESSKEFIKGLNNETFTTGKVTTNTTMNSGESKLEYLGDIYFSSDEKVYANITIARDNIKKEIEKYVEGNKEYTKIKGILDNFYYEDLVDDTQIDPKLAEGISAQTEVVFDYLADTIVDKINQKEISVEKVKKTFDGTEYDTKKVKVSFTEKDIVEIIIEVLKKVKDNKELSELIAYAIKNYEELDGLSLDTMISNLEGRLNDLDNEKEFIAYAVYEYKDKIMSNEYSITVDSDGTAVTLKLTVNKYTNKNNFENLEIYLSAMGINVVEFTSKGQSATKSSLTLYVLNMLKAEGTYEKDGNNFTVSLKANTPLDDSSTFDLEMAFKEIEKDKKCTFNAKMIMGTGSTAINLNSENEIELGVEMPKVDVSGAKSVDEMTEEQREAYNNIYDILNFSEIDDNDDEFNDYIFED